MGPKYGLRLRFSEEHIHKYSVTGATIFRDIVPPSRVAGLWHATQRLVLNAYSMRAISRYLSPGCLAFEKLPFLYKADDTTARLPPKASSAHKF